MNTFRVEEKQNEVIIHLPSEITEATGKELAKYALSWMKTPLSSYVMNMAGVKKLDQSFYRPVMLLSQFQKKGMGVVSTVNMSDAIITQIKQDGMEEVFQPLAVQNTDLPEIFNKFVDSFKRHTEKVFKIQCNMQVIPGTYELRELAPTDEVCIAGVISVHGKALNATAAICFPSSVFLEAYSSMFMEEVTTIAPEMRDASAELLNIIFGQAKIELNDQDNYQIEKAIPSVIVGENLTLQRQGPTKVVVIPFRAKTGNLYLQISV